MADQNLRDVPPDSAPAPGVGEIPSRDAAGQGESPGDILSAWKKLGAGSVSFERTGGGEGPGWSGKFYQGAEVQMGGPFDITDSDLNDILRRAREALGGGRYHWRVRDSRGKWHEDDITFPGAPKQLPGVEDPAAAAQAEYLRQFGASPNPYQDARGFNGGQNGYGAGYQQQAAGLAPVRRPPIGWNWSQAANGWYWVSEDGEITDPPPGLRPPQLPGGGHGHGGFVPPYLHDTEAPLVKQMREELKELKTMMLAKSSNGDGGLAAVLVSGMKASADMMAASAAADRAAATARAEADRATRVDERAAQAEMRKLERSVMDRLLNANAPGAAGHADPIRSAIDKAIAEKVATSLFSDGKKDKDDDQTPQERIGEKVVDGLTKLVDFGKTWLDKSEKDEKPGDKPPPKKNAPQPQVPSHNDEGVDRDVAAWLTLLDVASEAYQTGRSPQAAFEMLYAACKGGNLNFSKIHTALGMLTSAQILDFIGSQSEPVKSRSAPLRQTLGTGDGLSWFEGLLAHAKKVPTE